MIWRLISSRIIEAHAPGVLVERGFRDHLLQHLTVEAEGALT